jgi:protein associated with RNAse G/E
MFEIYTTDGEPEEIYINIASPFTLDNKVGHYLDYELDMSKKKGQPIVILDEEEFVNATEYYNYSKNFVSECRKSLELAITLAERWEWRNTFLHLREFGHWGD